MFITTTRVSITIATVAIAASITVIIVMPKLIEVITELKMLPFEVRSIIITVDNSVIIVPMAPIRRFLYLKQV
jgi:hypothetical protein